ncbi:MAG: CsbD family protein [Micromonosporaceae bacterium]|jgi:uncharacterized protein YjbJ (UPF0337 family)|nr:CsbD family protein [Micromonosporaceae bacterium]
MSLADKARNMAEEWKGRAKEKVGGAMKKENMQAEGAADREEARVRRDQQARETGQQGPDAFRG